MATFLTFKIKDKKNYVIPYYTKKIIQSLERGHLPPFDWKLFKLGSVSVRDIRKNVPILQVGGFTLAPPIPPVFRVALLNKFRLLYLHATCTHNRT